MTTAIRTPRHFVLRRHGGAAVASNIASVLPQNLPTVCEDCLEPGVLGRENKRELKWLDNQLYRPKHKNNLR